MTLDVETAAPPTHGSLLDPRHGQQGPLAEPESTPTKDLIPEARQHQKRRYRTGLIISLLIVLAVVAAAVGWDVASSNGPSRAPRPDAPVTAHATASLPKEMVVWRWASNKSYIQLISSTTGRVITTFASDVGLFRGTPQPSVSPDGTVYYDQSDQSQPGTGVHAPVEQIFSVPLSGGPSTLIADGHDPEVSPNGKFLAYQAWTDLTNRPEAVVVKNLSTGTLATWQFATNTPDINAISWSPDSKSLIVSAETLSGTGPHSTWHFLIGRLVLAQPSGSLDDLPQVQLPMCPAPTAWAGPGANREMAWAGFLTTNEGIGVCHHVGLVQADSWTQPVIFNLTTGSVVRRLPVVRGLIGQGPGGGFEVDGSGHYLVFIGGGLGAGGLYHWTVIDSRRGHEQHPVFVSNNVGSAAWVPSGAQEAAAAQSRSVGS